MQNPFPKSRRDHGGQVIKNPDLPGGVKVCFAIRQTHGQDAVGSDGHIAVIIPVFQGEIRFPGFLPIAVIHTILDVFPQ